MEHLPDSRQTACLPYTHPLCDGEQEKKILLDTLPAAEGKMAPFQVQGDGHCLLHAVCTALCGSCEASLALRTALVAELEDNAEFYRAAFAEECQDCEWEQVLCSARGKERGPDMYLGFQHVFAISNIFKRPIFVYAPKSCVDRFGEGSGGARSSFLPLRHRPEDCCKTPIVITFTNTFLNHFAPVVPIYREDGPCKMSFDFLPRMEPSYTHAVEEAERAGLLDRYVDMNVPIVVFNESYTREQIRTQSVAAPTNRKLVNPEDGQEYDIVLPIQVGTKLAYLAYDYQDDGAVCMVAFHEFIQKYNITSAEAETIRSYIKQANTLFYWGCNMTLREGLESRVREENPAAVKIARAHPELHLPIALPVRFNAKPRGAKVQEMLKNHPRKTQYLEAIKTLHKRLDKPFLFGDRGEQVAHADISAADFSDIMMLLLPDRLKAPEEYQLDFFRYAFLDIWVVMKMNAMDKMGYMMNRCCTASAPIGAKILAVQMAANVMSHRVHRCDYTEDYVDVVANGLEYMIHNHGDVMLMRRTVAVAILNVASCWEGREFVCLFPLLLEMLKREYDQHAYHTELLALGTFVMQDRLLAETHRARILEVLEHVKTKPISGTYPALLGVVHEMARATVQP